MSNTRESVSRSWGLTEDGKIKFESLTDETLEGALNVLRKSFFIYESVCIAVELTSEPGASEELEELCLNAAKDGVSVVAIDIGTNEVVGVAFNKIQVSNNDSEKSFYENFSDNCRYKSSKALVNFMNDMDEQINLFEHYSVNSVLELMFLATLPTYGKRRIGEMLVMATLEVGKELKCGKNVKVPVTIHGSNKMTNADVMPAVVSATMTSNYSYRIAVKLHFDILFKVTYDKFEFNGKKYSERLSQVHRESVLVAKRR